MVVRLKLEPFAIHLHHTIDQLQAADTANIFGRPVTLQEVNLHCVSKKPDTKLLPITSPNVNRFSKFFHW